MDLPLNGYRATTQGESWMCAGWTPEILSQTRHSRIAFIPGEKKKKGAPSFGGALGNEARLTLKTLDL